MCTKCGRVFVFSATWKPKLVSSLGTLHLGIEMLDYKHLWTDGQGLEGSMMMIEQSLELAQKLVVVTAHSTTS